MKYLEAEKGGATVAAPSALKGRRVASVMFSNFPADPRPRRAAEALAREGANVEVICLRETETQPLRESCNGIDVIRIPLKRRRGGKLSYVLQYGSFILWVGALLAGRTFKRRFDLVHIHNMPDVLVFSALVPKIFGARVILDLHDPMPELMMTIFGLKELSFGVQLLKMLERLSIRFVDAALTTNQAFRKLFIARGCPPAKISVVMNSPDEDIFEYRDLSQGAGAPRDPSKPFIIMYHGSLVERHGLDLAVSALAKARVTIPNAELRIYGSSTPFLESVMDSVQKSDLAQVVHYMGPMKLEQIPAAIRECDVGVIPNRRSTFTELNMPTRIFEYLSQGKPSIAPRTPGICDYFSPEELILFELGEVDDLALKIRYVFSHPEEMAKMVRLGQKVYRAHEWSGERRRLVDLVKQLVSG